ALAVFAAADAGLCKSGTTTLEAALADMPMAIAYRLHPVSFAIAIRMLRVPYVGLVNLIAEREVSPEFLQGAVRPDALADAVLPLLDPASAAARRQREGLALVRERLGPPNGWPRSPRSSWGERRARGAGCDAARGGAGGRSRRHMALSGAGLGTCG